MLMMFTMLMVTWFLKFCTFEDWGEYTKLPGDYISTFYWWQPDPTFLRTSEVGGIAFFTKNLCHVGGDVR